MIGPHPAEIDMLSERVERLEQENQRLREIVSAKADHEVELQRRIDTLERELSC